LPSPKYSKYPHILAPFDEITYICVLKSSPG
jgi:hypothetical protein